MEFIGKKSDFPDDKKFMIPNLKQLRSIYFILQSSFRIRMLSLLANFPDGELRIREFCIFLRVREEHEHSVRDHLEKMVEHGVLKKRNGYPGTWYSFNIDQPYKNVLLQNILYLYEHSPSLWADVNFMKMKYPEVLSTIKDFSPSFSLKKKRLDNFDFGFGEDDDVKE